MERKTLNRYRFVAIHFTKFTIIKVIAWYKIDRKKQPEVEEEDV